MFFFCSGRYHMVMDGAMDAFICELVYKEKHTIATSETKSRPEQKGFYGFCLHYLCH